jgi:hypothetical protein
MGFLGRLFLGTGELPARVRAELEAEGLVLLEEGLSGSIRYSHFKAPGKRFNGKVTPQRMGIGISEKRVVVYCRSGRAELIDSQFDSPRLTAVVVFPEGNDKLNIHIDYDEMPDAETADVSGQITIRLHTPRASTLLEALEKRLPGSAR